LMSFISKVTPFVLYKRTSPSIHFSASRFNYHISTYFSVNNNYYLYDSITRNSKIMSLCNSKFKTKRYNFF
jgi:hypothetical protein